MKQNTQWLAIVVLIVVLASALYTSYQTLVLQQFEVLLPVSEDAT